MQFGDLSVKKHRLYIGGCDATALAEKYGTPLYVFDVSRAEKTAKAYIDALRREYPDFTVCYASKAFCCTGIYGMLAPSGLGADVVSGGELYTALKGGMPPERIYFHGNNKTESEIEYALNSGVGCFVVDSERELMLIDKHAAKPQNVMVRVNPGIEAHTHRFIQTALADSKFGFSLSDGTCESVINEISRYKNLRFCGISCHIGSQIFELSAFETAIDLMTDLIMRLNADGIEAERLDLGGGFGIKYIDGDMPLAPTECAVSIARHLKTAVEKRAIKPPKLIIEPGRSIVGEAGITLYEIGAIKTVKGIGTYAAVDGGMFDNPRPLLYDAEYTAVVADRADAPPEEVYTVVGKCCESGDVLIRDAKLPKLNSGDIIAVLSTGAYHYSMASNYNRNAVPPTVAVKNGKSSYMVKPQTYEDIARNDAIPFSEDGL